MCGRYDNLIARDAYQGMFKANRLPKSNFPLRYTIAPTDPMVRWGVPADTKKGFCRMSYTLEALNARKKT